MKITEIDMDRDVYTNEADICIKNMPQSTIDALAEVLNNAAERFINDSAEIQEVV